MKIKLSIHARKRLIEREINMRNVIETIEFPDYTVRCGAEREAYKKIGAKTVKVVYVEEVNFIKVITVYWI